jgi:hypothetical protein
VKNQIDKKIKMLRFDNDGEFTSRAFYLVPSNKKGVGTLGWY